MNGNKSNGSVLILRGGRGIGGIVRGPALVSRQGFGIRYDLDPTTGIITNPEHDLHGEALAGRIMVFTESKGGVAASWGLPELKRRGLAPIGLIARRAGPIFAQGAILAGISLIHELCDDPCLKIRTGDEVELSPADGTVTIYRSA